MEGELAGRIATTDVEGDEVREEMEAKGGVLASKECSRRWQSTMWECCGMEIRRGGGQ